MNEMLKRKGTSKPKKVRKRKHHDVPLHRRQKKMMAPLAEEAKIEYTAKRLPVRRGDKVIVEKGDFEGQIGKVTRVDLKDYQIYIDGVSIEKASGQEIHIPVRPWNVSIMEPKLDNTRKQILERKKKSEEWEEQEASTSEEESSSKEENEETETNE